MLSHDSVPHELSKVPHDTMSHNKVPHDCDRVPHDKVSHDKVQQKLLKFIQLENQLKEVYSYCQHDSIQETKLQNHLGLLMQMVQISSLTKLQFSKCVFNAIGQKVEAVVNEAYMNHDLMYIDHFNQFDKLFNPYTKWVEANGNQDYDDWMNQFNKVKNKENRALHDRALHDRALYEVNTDLDKEETSNESQSSIPDEFLDAVDPQAIVDTDQDKILKMADEINFLDETRKEDEKKYLRNIGGHVQSYESGFMQSITAFDVESMYPGQIEACNIDKACLITAENMANILNNYEKYDIKSFNITRLIDMYSPTREEQQKWLLNIQSFKFDQNIVFITDGEPNGDVYNGYETLYNLPSDEMMSNKAYRWQIEIKMLDGRYYKLQQFFYEKKNQVMKYSFCFLVQGRQYSPIALFLNNFRNYRVEFKSLMKDAQAKGDKEKEIFYDSKQGSIKLVANSTYGQFDYGNGSLFNMFLSSLITKQSRYTIENARQALQSQYLILPKGMDMQYINKYNEFIGKAYVSNEVLLIEVIKRRSEEEASLVAQLKKMGLTEQQIDEYCQQQDADKK